MALEHNFVVLGSSIKWHVTAMVLRKASFNVNQYGVKNSIWRMLLALLKRNWSPKMR